MTADDRPRTYYCRRTIGATVCLSPVVLLAASLAVGREAPSRSAVGIGFVVAAVGVTALNLYTSFVRPLAYRRRHGSLDGMRNVSGAPLAGTLFATAAGVIGFGDPYVATAGLFVLACDLGGLPWFLVLTWRDRSLWDEVHNPP